MPLRETLCGGHGGGDKVGAPVDGSHIGVKRWVEPARG